MAYAHPQFVLRNMFLCINMCFISTCVRLSEGWHRGRAGKRRTRRRRRPTGSIRRRSCLSSAGRSAPATRESTNIPSTLPTHRQFPSLATHRQFPSLATRCHALLPWRVSPRTPAAAAEACRGNRWWCQTVVVWRWHPDRSPPHRILPHRGLSHGVCCCAALIPPPPPPPPAASTRQSPRIPRFAAVRRSP